MKTIQVTIDEPLLLRVDTQARCEDLARSAWIREVIEDALWERNLDELNRQDREGYAANPQTDEEINEWLEVQAWDDDPVYDYVNPTGKAL